MCVLQFAMVGLFVVCVAIDGLLFGGRFFVCVFAAIDGMAALLVLKFSNEARQTVLEIVDLGTNSTSQNRARLGEGAFLDHTHERKQTQRRLLLILIGLRFLLFLHHT